MSKEAMKLALEALKQIDEAMPFPVAKLAQAALREALAEQPAQQEPVAWLTEERYAQLHTAQRTCSDYERDGMHHDKPQKRPQNCGTGYCSCIECMMEPAQQEPVAKYIGECSSGSLVQLYDDVKKGTDFYTFPPAQRTWVGLTEDEVFAVSNTMPYADRFDFAKAIEAKLKEKNNG